MGAAAAGVGGGSTCNDRPNLLPGRDSYNITHGTTAGCAGVAPGRQLGTQTLFFDPCAFSTPAAGFYGTAGRNILRGPAFANLDFSVVKDTRIRALGEGGQIQFRAEIFNARNHANFGFNSAAERIVYAGRANVEKANPAAGVLLSTVNPSRQIQLALKLMF